MARATLTSPEPARAPARQLSSPPGIGRNGQTGCRTATSRRSGGRPDRIVVVWEGGRFARSGRRRGGPSVIRASDVMSRAFDPARRMPTPPQVVLPGALGRLARAMPLSLWSEGSFLSIGSKGSVLSIGSIGSACSIGSIGSACSLGSIGSSLSICSIGSFLSAFSVLSAGSLFSVLSSRSQFSMLSHRSKGFREHDS